MSDDFDQPSSGDMFVSKDNNGRLLLIENIKEQEVVSTKMGMADVVRCNVTVLDDPAGPQTYENTMVFGKALVGTLSRAKAGAKVLGRLGQGEAKSGQSAPWILQEFSEADKAAAAAYVKSRDESQFSSPVKSETKVEATLPDGADLSADQIKALMAQANS